MKKMCLPLVFLVALSGCATQMAPQESCTTVAAYEVTLDSWCGNGCDNYPVSHKMRDNRSEHQRVELNALPRVSPCFNP